MKRHQEAGHLQAKDSDLEQLLPSWPLEEANPESNSDVPLAASRPVSKYISVVEGTQPVRVCSRSLANQHSICYGVMMEINIIFCIQSLPMSLINDCCHHHSVNIFSLLFLTEEIVIFQDSSAMPL